MAGFVLASGLVAPPARAGTYKDIQSGGTSPAVITPAADAEASSPQGAVAAASGGGGSTTYTITIKPGTLTDAFTWVPASGQTTTTDPPPTCVLVQQSSYAQWFVHNESSPGTGSGQADCGLPGGTVTDATYQGNGPANGLSATLYSQKSGASFSVSSTPTASFTGTTGAYGYVEGEARVGGGANVSPIIITPGGTMPVNGTQYGLTGQQITATLSGIPTGFTVTKYKWSGQSGTCFKTYNEKATSNQLTPLGSTDTSGTATGSNTVPPLAFYDSAAENLIVICTVTVLAPDGKTSVNLTATAPTINVLKPTLTRWDIAEGYVQYDPSYDAGQYGLLQTFGLYGNLSGSGDSTNGMIWSNVTVSVPAPFSGNGQCTFTQLVNPNHLDYNGTSSTPDAQNNGILGLDGSFEYGNPWSVTAIGGDVDSPALSVGAAGKPQLNTNSYTQRSASDAFATYVMYQPSGGVWIPLDKISWSWSETLTWQSSRWNLTASYPQTAGQAPNPTPTAINAPPQWTVVH